MRACTIEISLLFYSWHACKLTFLPARKGVKSALRAVYHRNGVYLGNEDILGCFVSCVRVCAYVYASSDSS